MKTKDTMSDNELIAEFMGVAPAKAVSGDSRMYHKFETETGERLAVMGEAGYSYSWDWLMPVVEKIESLMPHINIPADLEALRNGTHGSEPHVEVLSLSIASKISEVYAEVITFIKWYNANQPKP